MSILHSPFLLAKTLSSSMKGYFYVSCITKSLERRNVISKFSLSIAPGEVIMILGPKGSGKTMLLNALTRFICPTKGDVFYNSSGLYSWKESIKASKEELNFH